MMFKIAEPLIVESDLVKPKCILNDGVTIDDVNSAIEEKLKQNRLKRKKSLMFAGLNRVI